MAARHPCANLSFIESGRARQLHGRLTVGSRFTRDTMSNRRIATRIGLLRFANRATSKPNRDES
jgi:hypothetical protein